MSSALLSAYSIQGRLESAPQGYRADTERGHDAGVCEPELRLALLEARELRLGDRVYGLPCMSRLVVVEGEGGRLQARARY